MDLYALAGPVIRLLPPEDAHALAIFALGTGLMPSPDPVLKPALAVNLWGLSFSNPVGLAAGFDKNAEVTDGLLRQGFGFVEAGTVTPLPQKGNPRPRLYRLPKDKAIINRMGFNNAGVDRAARNLEQRKEGGPVGLNIGPNKNSADRFTDFELVVLVAGAFVDYIAINLSSPNTPGLRDLQDGETMKDIVTRVRKVSRVACPARRVPVPVLVKIAPDLTHAQMKDIAAAALEISLDGLIVGNTTVQRPDTLKSNAKHETGGLSGPPLREMSNRVLARMHDLTEGKIPLIGCGGVASGAEAYEKILCGASLVQLYTALVWEGPGVVAKINRELADILKREGYTHISEAVGKGKPSFSHQPG